MRLDISQHMRMEQRMKLAPRMIQSMEILQLPLMALQERIEQELAENPVLELREPVSVPESSPTEESEHPDQSTLAERPLVIDEKGRSDADNQRLDEIGRDWQEHFDSAHRPSAGALAERSDRKHQAEQNMPSRPAGLCEHLIGQLGMMGLSSAAREACEVLIAHLDESGYLKVPLEELTPRVGPQATPALMQQALACVQRLEPPGVGARNLPECLLLQLDDDDPLWDVKYRLVTEHLKDIQQNRYPAIERKTGLSMETIQQAVAEISRLNPRPGAVLSAEAVPCIKPDIIVEAIDNGYVIRLDDEVTPPLEVSQTYQDMAKDQRIDDNTRQFVRSKLQSARWLLESIEQRKNTLKRVATAILNYQRDFLDHGPTRIRPLKMQQIADRVGVHVTTVSRAVDGKYAQTPRGIFPLRRFFGGGMEKANGEVVAWDRIRQRLTDLVAKEDKSNPYSDDQLVEILQREGVAIARRTVTKYRKSLDIPSSRQRRQY